MCQPPCCPVWQGGEPPYAGAYAHLGPRGCRCRESCVCVPQRRRRTSKCGRQWEGRMWTSPQRHRRYPRPHQGRGNRPWLRRRRRVRWRKRHSPWRLRLVESTLYIGRIYLSSHLPLDPETGLRLITLDCVFAPRAQQGEGAARLRAAPARARRGRLSIKEKKRP